MIRYVGILEKEPGSLWGIWFPDLPGCVSASATAEQTIESAAEALQLWVDDARDDGHMLPPARSVADLRDDPEVSAAFAKGDVAIMVSYASENDRVPLDPQAITAIDAAAARTGSTRADFVRQAVLEKLAS